MRKFLEGLGLEKDVVEKIMAEYGKGIEAEQTKAKEESDKNIATLTAQLEETKTALKGFDGVNVDEMKTKIAELSKSMADKDEAYRKDIADRDFETLVSNKIRESGGKNSKAVRALLDIDTLKASKNQDADVDKAIAACKESDSYLFGEEEPIRKPVSKIGADNNGPSHDDQVTSMLRSVMGLKPEKGDK